MFFNYGYVKEKYKVLYSHYKGRIPNAFCGTMFKRHRVTVESGELESDRCCLFFFCSSVTNRNEEINQHLKNVSITPIYVELKKLNEWAGNGQFDPSHLVFLSVKKEVSTAAVVKGLEHICQAPNSNLVRNADGLLSSRAAENSVDWIDESKVRIPHQKFKVSC